MSKCCIKSCNEQAHRNTHRCIFHYKEYRNSYYAKNKELLREREKPKEKIFDRTPKRRFKRAQTINKNIGWFISYESWLTLVSQKCYYCDGALPETGYGLDRKNPTGQYVLDNVVSCCAECNKTKRNRFNCEEFKIMMDALFLWKKNKVN